MAQIGLLLSDVPASVPPQQQFSDLQRIVAAAQRNGFTYIAIGQHFLYGDLRWLQPVPLLARLAAEVDPHIRLVTQILIAPLYHPVLLAEEIATLDVVTEGRLVFGAGLGYRPGGPSALGGGPGPPPGGFRLPGRPKKGARGRVRGVGGADAPAVDGDPRPFPGKFRAPRRLPPPFFPRAAPAPADLDRCTR